MCSSQTSNILYRKNDENELANSKGGGRENTVRLTEIKSIVHSMISKFVYRTLSVERHYESKHKSIFLKSEEEQKGFISRALRKPIQQSILVIEFVARS